MMLVCLNVRHLLRFYKGMNGTVPASIFRSRDFHCLHFYFLYLQKYTQTFTDSVGSLGSSREETTCKSYITKEK